MIELNKNNLVFLKKKKKDIWKSYVTVGHSEHNCHH